MSILLGNMSVEEIEKRLNIELTDEERLFLSNTRQQEAANIAEDKWHCFDMPFVIVCGSYDFAVKVHEILKSYSSKMKGTIQIAINEKLRKEGV